MRRSAIIYKGIILVDLAGRFETPLLVYDLDKIERFRDAV